MRTMTRLLVLALLAFVPVAFAQQPTDLSDALDRLGTHPPPAPFGEKEAAENARLRKLLAEKRRAILNAENDPTDEELAAASAEMRPAYDRLRKLDRHISDFRTELQYRRNAWELRKMLERQKALMENR